MSVKPEDLTPAQRRTFEMWRSIGLSEERALDAMVEDGALRLSDHDRAAHALRKTFRLSAGQAESAVGGRQRRFPLLVGLGGILTGRSIWMGGGSIRRFSRSRGGAR